MNNKEFQRRAVRHGECLLLPIDKLPENADKVFSGNTYIVAHSESGHNHVAVADSLDVFSFEGRTFLRVGENGRIEHKKSFDFHETKGLVKGLYESVAKTAYNYFRKVQERVID